MRPGSCPRGLTSCRIRPIRRTPGLHRVGPVVRPRDADSDLRPGKAGSELLPRDMPFLLISGTADNIVVSQINAAMQQAFCIMDESTGRPVVPFRASWSPTMTGLNTPPAVSFNGSSQGNTLIVDSLTGGTGAPYTKLLKSVAPGSASQPFQNLGKVNVGDTLVSYGPDATTQTPAPAGTKVASIDYDNQVVTFNQALTPTGTTLVLQPATPARWPWAPRCSGWWEPHSTRACSPRRSLRWGPEWGSRHLPTRPCAGQGAAGRDVPGGVVSDWARGRVAGLQSAGARPPQPADVPLHDRLCGRSGRGQCGRLQRRQGEHQQPPGGAVLQPGPAGGVPGRRHRRHQRHAEAEDGDRLRRPQRRPEAHRGRPVSKTITFKAGGPPNVVGQTVLNPQAKVAADTAVTYNNAASDLLGFTADVFAGKTINPDCHEVDEMRPTRPSGSGAVARHDVVRLPQRGVQPHQVARRRRRSSTSRGVPRAAAAYAGERSAVLGSAVPQHRARSVEGDGGGVRLCLDVEAPYGLRHGQAPCQPRLRAVRLVAVRQVHLRDP